MGMMTDTELEQTPAPVVTNPAFFSIPLRNNPSLLRILSSVMNYLGADNATWQAPGTFHVSLCMGVDMSDKVLKRVISRIAPPDGMDLYSAGINVFATPDGYALHLALKRTDALMQLQAGIYELLEAEGIECSMHNVPTAFNPHITLGYFKENPITLSGMLDEWWFSARVSAIEVTRNGYQRVALIGDETQPWRFIDRFSLVNANEWFRIMPLGKFDIFDRQVEVTYDMIAEMVENFRNGVPETKLPVNREHQDQYGKVGNISDLEARADGLYACFDWLPSGVQALAEKAFQYFSPEVCWRQVTYKGKKVKNILVGLALTNVPYFGNSTALYSAGDFVNNGAGGSDPEPIDYSSEGGSSNMDEAGIKKIVADAFAEAAAQQALTPAVPVDEFNAVKSELAQLKQEAEDYKRQAAESARLVRVEKFKAILGPGSEAQAEKFAALADQQQAEELAQEFKALRAQANPDLFKEIGSSTPRDLSVDNAEKFTAMVEAKVAGGMSAVEAMNAVAKENPGLWDAYRAQTGRGQ